MFLPFVELRNELVTLRDRLVRNIIRVNALLDDELEVTDGQDGDGYRDD